MPTVVVSTHNVADFVDGGGHAWVYLQYVHGLRALGCDVWWLEEVDDPERARRLSDRLAEHGLTDRVLTYARGAALGDRAASVIAGADLLVNFHYEIDRRVLARFRRTALVDIDPGRLQLWMARGNLDVPVHDLHFTTGETVGTPAARFPDGGREWLHIRPAVATDAWSVSDTAPDRGFTTVSTWWSDNWINHDDGTYYDDNKRAAFLEYAELPGRATQPLELAAYWSPRDGDDVRRMRAGGWRLHDVRDVVSTPADYRAYVRSSRGEFSIARASCVRFQNAWVSDRTLCYLASGRPAVVQHTGPNPYLDGGEGVLRFSTPDEAAGALEAIGTDYDRHRRAARALVEEHFDARRVAQALLESALA